MTVNRTPTAAGLWGRARNLIGRLVAGMVSSAAAPGRTADSAWNDYPRFPPY